MSNQAFNPLGETECKLKITPVERNVFIVVQNCGIRLIVTEKNN